MEYNNGECVKWTHGDIKRLLQKCEAYSDKFENNLKKRVWDELAADMQAETGKPYTGEQCNGKWKGLKAMFKKYKNRSNISGYRRCSWEFYNDVESILHRRSELANLYRDKKYSDINYSDTKYSDTKYSDTKYSDTKYSDMNFFEVGADFSVESDELSISDIIEEQLPSTYVQTRKPAPATEILKKRKRQRVETSTKEQRHRDRMAQNERFLDLFERLIQRIENQ